MRKPKSRWVASIREKTKNGGPVFWVKENYRGPNCETKYRASQGEHPIQFDFEKCCDGKNMVPDADTMEEDDNVS